MHASGLLAPLEGPFEHLDGARQVPGHPGVRGVVGVEDGHRGRGVDRHELAMAGVVLDEPREGVQEQPRILPVLLPEDPGGGLPVAALQDLGEQGALGGEVVQQARLGDVRGVGDVGQGGARVAARAEQGHGLVEDPLALVLAAGGGPAGSAPPGRGGW